MAFSYADYRGQVLDYLDPDAVARFDGEARWHELVETLYGLVEGI